MKKKVEEEEEKQKTSARDILIEFVGLSLNA